MTPDEITDEDSLKAWLEGQTREVAVTIAHRTAMRVAPLFWRHGAPVSRTYDLTATVSARPLLIAGVAGTCPTPAIRTASDAAAYAANAAAARAAAAATAAQAAAHAAAAAARAAAATAALAAAHAAAVAAAHAAAAASAAARKYGEGAYGTGAYGGRKAVDQEDPAAIWEGVLQDAARLNGREIGQPAAATPLWRNGENPFAGDWQQVRTAWATTNDPGWQFWIDWYVAALDGKPLLGAWDRHWALLTDIALIDPDDWDAGPDTVNPLVAQKYEIHGLRAEADRLKRKLQRAEATAATAAHRSHNQPPDLVETPSVQQYRVVLQALDDAETELTKPDPSSSRLRAIANVLLDWTRGMAAYCAELGDVALREVAKGIGRAAVPGTALFLAAQSEQVRQLANALLDLSSRLP